MIQIGCVADDFTGASDWASFFAEKGVRVLLYNGIPQGDFLPLESEVVVIALKTRTVPLHEAVEETTRALGWLEKQGTRQYYIKYCSTFDCTREGNIGPVVDAAMDMLGECRTILCPALPVNGRTTRDGKLYVNGVELQESSMKNHPLTPMWDCRLSELMKEQSRGKVISLSAQMYEDRTKTESWMQEQLKSEEHVYFVPDFYEEIHGEHIVELFGDDKLLTGGSGLCSFLADKIKKNSDAAYKGTKGTAALIAGSCSQMTLKQIETYLSQGKKAVKISPADLLNKTENADTLWEKIQACAEKEILVYSSEEPDVVLKNQKNGKDKVSRLIEQVQAELAEKFVESGTRRIIVAGGETSGAITKRLGYDAYIVGKSIAPGVPVLTPVGDSGVRLVLKSGNFGQEDFFLRALEITGEEC